jgi:sphingomyelin phosphodiesterase 2
MSDGGGLTVVSLNTRGIPLVRSHLAERYHAIAEILEDTAVDVVSFQEVFTYCHLRWLTARMPSFRHVGYRPSPVGPAGGLVTLSRLPIAGSRFRRFPFPRDAAELAWITRLRAPLKGSLVTWLVRPHLRIINTHPLANRDGDWSESNRFFAVQRGQLAALARIVRADPLPAVVCGDFNVARDSSLHRAFIADTGLADAFGGRCPPTFHAEYLGPGKSPVCIDFVLVTESIKVETADVIFTGREALPYGPDYVSDHVGLRVGLRTSGAGA